MLDEKGFIIPVEEDEEKWLDSPRPGVTTDPTMSPTREAFFDGVVPRKSKRRRKKMHKKRKKKHTKDRQPKEFIPALPPIVEEEETKRVSNRRTSRSRISKTVTEHVVKSDVLQRRHYRMKLEQLLHKYHVLSHPEAEASADDIPQYIFLNQDPSKDPKLKNLEDKYELLMNHADSLVDELRRRTEDLFI